MLGNKGEAGSSLLLLTAPLRQLSSFSLLPLSHVLSVNQQCETNSLSNTHTHTRTVHTLTCVSISSVVISLH